MALARASLSCRRASVDTGTHACCGCAGLRQPVVWCWGEPAVQGFGAAAAAKTHLEAAPVHIMRLPPLDNARVRRGSLWSAAPSKGRRRMVCPVQHQDGLMPQQQHHRRTSGVAHRQVCRAWHRTKDPGWRCGPIRPSDRGRETPTFFSAPGGSFERPKGLALQGHRDPSVAGVRDPSVASPAGLLLALLRPEPSGVHWTLQQKHAFTQPRHALWQHPCAAAVGRGCPTDRHTPTQEHHKAGAPRRCEDALMVHTPSAVSSRHVVSVAIAASGSKFSGASTGVHHSGVIVMHCCIGSRLGLFWTRCAWYQAVCGRRAGCCGA